MSKPIIGNSPDSQIPWEHAKAFAKKHGQKQVIIWCWDGKSQHLVTWGETMLDSDQAAQGANYLARHLFGWPEPHGCQRSERVQQALAALEEAMRILEPMARQIIAPKNSRLAGVVKQLNEALALFQEEKA